MPSGQQSAVWVCHVVRSEYTPQAVQGSSDEAPKQGESIALELCKD